MMRLSLNSHMKTCFSRPTCYWSGKRRPNTLGAYKCVHSTTTQQHDMISFIHGWRSTLTDSEGNRYLDFSTGPKVNPFGHACGIDELYEDHSLELVYDAVSESESALNVPWHDPTSRGSGVNASAALANKHRELCESIRESLSDSLGKDAYVRLVNGFTGIDVAYQIIQLSLALDANSNIAEDVQSSLLRAKSYSAGKHPWDCSFRCTQRSTGEAAHGGRKPTAKSRIPRNCLVEDNGRCACWDSILNMPSQSRNKILCFQGSEHGHTVAGLSLTHNPVFRSLLNTQLPRVIFAQYGDVNDAARFISNSKDIGAVLVEPAQWNTMKFAGYSFMKALREMCTDAGVLLVIDERNFMPSYHGSTWSHTTATHVTPDMVLGRLPTTGNHTPIEFVATSSQLDCVKALYSSVPSTHSWQQLSECLHLFHLLRTESLNEDVREKGRLLISLCRSLQARYPHLIKGVSHGEEPGLAVALHLEWETNDIIRECMKRGLLLECCGRNDETIRVCPPLAVSLDEIHNGISLLDKALHTSDLL